MRALQFLIFILSFYGLNLVQAQAINDTTDPCERYDQASMNLCASQNYDQVTLTMNHTLLKVKTCLEPENLWASVLASQNAWETYKSTHCEVDADLNWGAPGLRGSGWSLGFYVCMSTLTEQRITYLKEVYQSWCSVY